MIIVMREREKDNEREREREGESGLVQHNVHYSRSGDTGCDHVFAFHRFSPENRGVKSSAIDKFQFIV